MIKLGLTEKVIIDTIQKKKFAERLKFVLNEGNINSLKKEIGIKKLFKIGHIVYLIAEKLPALLNYRLKLLLDYALNGKLNDPHQLDVAIKYLKDHGEKPLTEKEFEENAGIGKVYTDEDIRKEVLNHLKKQEKIINIERYRFNVNNLLYDVKKSFIFVDHKKVKDALDTEFLKMLGGRNDEEKIEEEETKTSEEFKKELGKLNKEMDEIKKKINEQKNKKSTESEIEIKKCDELLKSTKVLINAKESDIEKIKSKHKIKDEEIKKKILSLNDTNKHIDEDLEEEKDKLNKLVARDLKSSLNTKELLEFHGEFLAKSAGGAKILTRFPPEPNGYLHIGHAKAMRFSFTSAKNNGGKCYLRYDDTNPDKETKEYITFIEENVKWLGYEPWKITFASDCFEILHELAVKLIKKGKAFVCHQSKADVKEFRKNCVDSPYRNRSVEENLKLFEMMRQGRFSEKEVNFKIN